MSRVSPQELISGEIYRIESISGANMYGIFQKRIDTTANEDAYYANVMENLNPAFIEYERARFQMQQDHGIADMDTFDAFMRDNLRNDYDFSEMCLFEDELQFDGPMTQSEKNRIIGPEIIVGDCPPMMLKKNWIDSSVCKFYENFRPQFKNAAAADTEEE